MRHTAKYDGAINVIASKFQKQMRVAAKLPHDELYRMLFDKGYVWDNHAQEWNYIDEEARKFMSNGTTFADADGNPTPLFNLRIMCHPDKVEAVLDAIQTGQFEVGRADGPEPNRNGAGVRYYLNCRLPDGS